VKSLVKLILATALVSTSMAYAEVTLITPEEIPVLALDDQEVSGGFFRTAKTTYKLDAGQRHISVRYEQIFNLNDGNHDILKSAVVTVSANLTDGKTYYLKLVNPPKDNYEKAKAYVNQPIIAVVDDAGNTVAQQTGVDSTPKAWLGNGLFGRVFDLRKNDKKEIEKNLSNIREVLAFVSAPTDQGGTGAVLVLLKRAEQQNDAEKSNKAYLKR
jgi:hypothetical protein